MILLNDIDHFFNSRNMPAAGDLLLVAEDALEGAGELRDEDGDGVVLWAHLKIRVTGFGLRIML
jgi:hypothetical protein